MLIKDSVVVITGATAGIGEAIARNLAPDGGRLVLTGRRQARLDALQAELRPSGKNILCLCGDVQDREFCANIIEQTVATFGRIDVLINNAGVGHASHLTDIPEADFKTVWETNMYGLAWLSQFASRAMGEQTAEAHTHKRGQIINVSSIIEDRPMISQVIYSASKAAVNHYSRGLRMELANSDITVSILYPGLTHTEFHESKLGQKTGPLLRNAGIDPAEVAKVVRQAIIKQKLEIYITWYDLIFVQANRHFPNLTDQFFTFWINRKKKN